MQSTEEESKNTPLPKIDDYLHPLNRIALQQITPKVETILVTMKQKLESSKPGLMIKKEGLNIVNEEIKAFFHIFESLTTDNSIQQMQQYNTIIEASSFFHFYTTDEELKAINAVKPLNIDYLKALFDKLSEKGTLLLLMDFQYLKQLTESIKKIFGEEYSHNLFMKLYIIEKLPLVGLFTIQKMGVAKEPVKIGTIKLLVYEIYQDLTITKPISYTLNNMNKSITYMYEMYQYQGYLSSVHAGETFHIKIKEAFYSDNIECSMVIIDSNDPTLLEKKNCVSIIVGKNYANDFMYLTPEGNMALCQQVQATRIILIRPAPFNNDSTREIQNKMSTYIQLFRFQDCQTASIPVMMMSDEKNEAYDLYKTKDIIVRDVVENDQKDTIRQLIFTNNQNEIQSEIKLILTSKAKVKQERDSNHYIQLPTIEKFTNKNLVSCFDDNNIRMFYIKAILSGLFFINLDSFPETKPNILILGAGIGSINYFFDKVLKSNVNITAVELSKEVTQIGKEYFGLNSFDKEKENITWVFQDAKKYLEEIKQENYYDMIIIDINNSNPIEGLSPPPIFFDTDIISKIHSCLKPYGMYVINLMARSFQRYKIAFEQLDKFFPLIFQIENNEDLNKIHYCFKSKLQLEEYQTCYKNNLGKLSQKDIANLTVIEEEHSKIIKRVIDTENFKKSLKLIYD